MVIEWILEVSKAGSTNIFVSLINDIALVKIFHIAQFNRGINSFSDMTKGPGCALMGDTKPLVVLMKSK